MAPPIRLEALPPEAAVAAFRARGADLLESWAWQDVYGEAHAYAFTVAKSAGFDILGDLRDSLTEALDQGETFESWKKRITPVLQRKGWWGRQVLPDPLGDGAPAPAQLGSPARLRTIFETNMRVSYAAGRWSRIERLAARRPWLRYVAVLDERTRQSHRAWHGIVLRWDDPFWDTHAPPNGWRCRCTEQQLSDRDLRRYGYTPTEGEGDPDPEPPTPWRNPRTGETVMVPRGIDPGWGHNPGRAQQTAMAVMARMGTLPPEVAAILPTAAPQLVALARAEYRSWVQAAAKTMRPRGEVRTVGLMPGPVLRGLKALHAADPAVPVPTTAAITIRDDDVTHWLRDAKAKAGKALDQADLERLPEILMAPEAVYWDRQTESVLYVFQPNDPRKGKVAVRVGFAYRHHRLPTVGNVVRTGGYEDQANLDHGHYKGRRRFELLM